MTKYVDLLDRLATLTVYDAAINAEIECEFRYIGLRPAMPDDFDGKFGYSPGSIKTEHGFLQARRYTSSLDDVRDFAEAQLPGHGRVLTKVRCACCTEFTYICEIYRSADPEAERIGFGQHPLEAIAFIMAVIVAIDADAPVRPLQ